MKLERILERVDRPGKHNRLSETLRALLRSEEIGVLAAFLLICLVLAATTRTFTKLPNLLEVTRQASYVGIIVVGTVFVLSMGDVDLSVGSTLMLSAIVAGLAMSSGLNTNLAALLAILIGAICGFVNAGLSVLLRIPTIIVTLGTMSVYRGMGMVLVGGKPVSGFATDSLLFQIGGGRIGPIPGATIFFVGVVILGYFLYNRTPFGRRVCAIGSNRQAAQYSGIQITRYRFIVMIFQGMLCGLAGILTTVFLESADPTFGQGYELLAIAAAIIGGTSLAGGAGTIIGGFIGALLIAVINNGLVLLGVTLYWTGVATGAVIIAAVALDYLIKRRRLGL